MTFANAPDRLRTMIDWLATTGHPPAVRPTIASADASRRQYWRVQVASKQATTSLVVMDEPPPETPEQTSSIPPFLDTQGRLQAAGVAVPQVLAADPAQGFVLLEDLGDVTLMHWLTEHDTAETRQRLQQAVTMLPSIAHADARNLPVFDQTALQTEMDLLPDWYLTHLLQRAFTPSEKQTWQSACARITERLTTMPQVFVHRDYHSRNLMVLGDRLVTIDFQDAVTGPLPYDLVSLLRDSYVDWPQDQVAAMQRHFHQLALEQGFAVGDLEQFRQDFAWVAVQRHLKVLGIFARLSLRDGKHRYLDDLPLTWRHLHWALAQLPELSDLGALLASRAPTHLNQQSA